MRHWGEVHQRGSDSVRLVNSVGFRVWQERRATNPEWRRVGSYTRVLERSMNPHSACDLPPVIVPFVSRSCRRSNWRYCLRSWRQVTCDHALVPPPVRGSQSTRMFIAGHPLMRSYCILGIARQSSLSPLGQGPCHGGGAPMAPTKAKFRPV